jgi:DNA repair exonuclease SbcCD ATPase subunit
MGFFTVGNLITLGIMLLAFALYHQLTRRNSTLDKIREYGKRLKGELDEFVRQKETAVREYAVDLDVKQSAAKALLERLTLTDQELQARAETIAKIDERISAYDASLEELVHMTGRVQENLDRVRDEGVFVENALKRIAQAENRLKDVEAELRETHERFERENAVSMERASEDVLASVKSMLSDLQSASETIERRVEDHREALTLAERQREENLERDRALIVETLEKALLNAGQQADKLEGAALEKLRGQAVERIRGVRDAIEEKLKAYQEDSKAKVLEVQGTVRTLKDSWKKEREEFIAERQDMKADLQNNIDEFNAATLVQKEAWKKSSEEILSKIREQIALVEKTAAESGVKAGEQIAALEESAAETVMRITWEIEEQDKAIAVRIAEREASIEARITEQEQSFAETTGNMENQINRIQDRISLASGNMERKLEDILSETESRISGEFAQWEAAAAEAAQGFSAETSVLETRLADLRERITDDAATIESRLADALSEAEARAQAQANDELAKWEEAVAAKAADSRQLLEDLENTVNATASRTGQLVTEWDAAANEVSSRIERLFSDWENNAAERERQIGENIAGQLARQENIIIEKADEWERTAAETSGKVEAVFEQTLKQVTAKAEAAAAGEAERVDGILTALNEKISAYEKEADAAAAALQKKLTETAVETSRKALEETDARLEEYRAVQSRQYEALNSLAEDSSRLDEELRLYMRETENRVRQDFSLFEETSNREREAAVGAFDKTVRSMREEIDRLGQDLEVLKAKSYDNVSKQLDVFEDEFAAGLAERSKSIGDQLVEWKSNLDSSLSSMKEDFNAQRRQLELNLSEELRERLQDQRERLTADLEHLKAETAAFEEGVRNEMIQSGETLDAFKRQLEGDLAETRLTADSHVKAEIGRLSLSLAENLKQAQRELAASLKQIAGQVDERGGELNALQEASQKKIESWQEKLAARFKDTDGALEELRRRTRELIAENEERLTSIRNAIEDTRSEADKYKAEAFSHVEADVRQLDAAIANADRRIQDFAAQTKLFEQADILKQNLEHHIEDLRSDIDGLDQRRAEAAELEAQFVKIKRLEDEVNAKMTRFLSEQRRIELMEADFNRLLHTSQAVETKLTEVTASDDTLQAIQVQIRKFNDALAETEEKFQRIEKKNQTLEVINQGVDRNFNTLKQTEAVLKQLAADIKDRRDEQEVLRLSLEKLAADNEKAQTTADRLTLLDKDLAGIEDRIREMQKAREWIARAETRLEDLNKEIQDQVKLVGNVLKEEGGRDRNRGAPTAAIRENVIKLARQGWKVDEIAKAVKLGRGEVELILELNPGSR